VEGSLGIRVGEDGMDHRLPLHRQTGRLHDLIGRHVLQEISGNPGPECLRDAGARLVDGEQDDPGPRMVTTDLRGRLDPAHPGHANIHEDDIGPDLLLEPLSAEIVDLRTHVVITVRDQITSYMARRAIR